MQGDARMMPEEIRISEDTSARERLVLMLSTSISALQEQDGSALINSSSQSRHPPPSSELLNDWAALVIESMSVPGRYYHNVDHIFNVAAEMKPKKDAIPILAAIFHDVVYLTIDKQLSEKVQAIVESVIDYKDGDRTQKSLLPKDKLVHPLDRMVQRLFSYDPLPRPTRDVNETNEFLSAIVATRLLESYLPKEHLLQIAACIEASIPFRVVDDESFYSPMDSLYQRLKVTASKHCAEATDEFLIQTVQMAAFFANHDLGAFRSKDPMVFLNSSWRLLPEWNPMLLLTDSQQCTLSVMLESLLLMQQRYKQLPVPWIFQSFKDEPSQDVLDEWMETTKSNIAFVANVTTVRIAALRIRMDYMNRSYNSNHDKNLPRRALVFYHYVEETFDSKSTLFVHGEHDGLSSDLQLVQTALLTPRPFVCDWDATVCRFSAAVLTTVAWAEIQECGEGSNSVDSVPGDPTPFQRLPPAMQVELRNVVHDATCIYKL